MFSRFEFTTGDAAGQNMVTIATEAIREFVAAHCDPGGVDFVEGNFPGDKKNRTRNRSTACARAASAPHHARAHAGALAHFLDGRGAGRSNRCAGHYVNGRAAPFIACGQNAACVAEAATGVTRFEFEPEDGGILYAAVTLRNMIVGTVGGGTALPASARVPRFWT